MKNADQTVQSNDQLYYNNAFQLSLPLYAALKLDKNDPLFTFLHALKGVHLSRFVKPIRSNNSHSHDRAMLLRVLLFAYCNGKYSLSEIVQACRTDIRYMFLMRG